MEQKVKISGFTFVRDAVRLEYPIVESILSALPIVEEYIVNVGDCSDDTLNVIRGIRDPKIRIVETAWDPDRFVAGVTNADQTNIALEHCSHPWCLYLQADEIIHQEDFGRVLDAMARSDHRDDVDGLVFQYHHFWGCFDRVHRSHNWYNREIRAFKNHRNIRSQGSAQSFRRDGRKLRVMDSGAWIYHYGWVRHPATMRAKQVILDSLHHGQDWVQDRHAQPEKPWDYGPLETIPRFDGTHPAVMQPRIAAKEWSAEEFSDPDNPPDHEHLRLIPRLHSALERLIGRRIGAYSNWVLLD